MNKDYLVFITVITSLIISANLSIILNIPYFRQIIPFILLTFVPGILIIQLLKLEHLKNLEKLVLSVGLSLIFITSVGLITNYVFFSSKPLNVPNILIIMDILLIVLLLLGYLINRVPPFKISINLNKTNSYEKVVLISSILLPTLSLLGTYSVKAHNHYVFLYLLVFLIPILVIFISLINEKIRKDYIYPISIFAIGFSLILAYTLISNYIYGTDSNSEYYFFSTVVNAAKWQTFQTLQYLMPYESCITVTILPAVYQILLKPSDATLLFKLLFVLPLSLTPLIVYRIAKNYNNGIYSFLAAIFIVASISFFCQTEAYRTYVAVFFFALAVMILISSNINDVVKKLLFIVFVVGLVISHYSSTFVFFFVFLSSILILQILKFMVKTRDRKDKSKKPSFNSLYKQKGFLSIGLLILTSVIIFFWYSQITNAPFNSGVNFLLNTLGQFNDFFLAESRDPTIYQALGSTLSNATLIRYINFVTSWASIIFIAIGLLTALISKIDIKILTRIFKLNQYSKIDTDFLGLSISSFFILALAVILPYILVFYSLPRLYYFFLVLLSIFFVLGSKVVAQNLRIRKPYFLILIVLIPILLANIGITPQFYGTPNSILLNPPDSINNTYYIHDSEASSVKWLRSYRDININVYTDYASFGRLVSVASIPREDIKTITTIPHNGYTYLSYYNVKQNKLAFWRYADVWSKLDIKNFQNILNQNLIYDDGGSEILL